MSNHFVLGKFGFGPGIGHDGRGFVAGRRIGGGVPLRGAKLPGADLRGADLCGEDLEEADLRNADLRGADLSGAHLRNARLAGAQLMGANLEGANLHGASLVNAFLAGAYLEDADLYSANLAHAHVSPHHVPLIKASLAQTLASITVRGGGRFDLGDARHFSTYMPHGEFPGEESAEPYKPGSRNNFYGPDGELPPLPVNRNKPGRAPNPGLGTRRGPHGYKY